MIKFNVTLTLTAEELASFFEKPIFVGKSIAIHPISVVDSTDPFRGAPSNRARVSRMPRGSKVEAVIREVLADAPATTSLLKKALEKGGLKPSSVGATLSKMQRTGAVARSADGNWSLTDLPQAAQ